MEKQDTNQMQIDGEAFLKLTKARTSLINKQPFFGRLALMLKLKNDSGLPTMGTDGENLVYNPNFVIGISKDNLEGIIIHEILHCALGHVWRRGEREPYRWNLAADFAVNPIVKDNGFSLPSGALIESKYRNMMAEEIYEKLPPTEYVTVEMSTPSDDGGKGSSSNNENNSDGGGDSKSSGGNDGNGKNGKKSKKNGGRSTEKYQPKGNKECHDSHKLWKTSSKKGGAKRLSRMWEGALAEVCSRGRGSIPSGLERIVEDMTPKEDWKNILQAFLSSSLSDFDFMQRDRRTMDSEFYLPDLRDEKQLDDVVVSLDTSGSISSEMLNRFVSETKAILKFFPKTRGWLIECDADIGSVIEIQKAKSKSRFTGGGGTSHIPVFKEIDKRGWRPKVVICFTDLWTEFPNNKPSYPVIWVSPSRSHSAVPFGRVVIMHNAENL